ncbi:hypothetical protein [uncultured Eudoraea sp.]|uniref:hypothetical protein n=1 Tax=uncultured Eudoraea sp. TaxID=1035614 RepID=UPI00345C536D
MSLILLFLTGPIGFLYGILHSLFTKGFRGVGEYLLKIAVSVDQLGNVLMQHLLNALWITKEGYKFGNRDETISSALGRNKVLGTLNHFGNGIDKILDIIDPSYALRVPIKMSITSREVKENPENLILRRFIEK